MEIPVESAFPHEFIQWWDDNRSPEDGLEILRFEVQTGDLDSEFDVLKEETITVKPLLGCRLRRRILIHRRTGKYFAVYHHEGTGTSQAAAIELNAEMTDFVEEVFPLGPDFVTREKLEEPEKVSQS